MDTPDATETDPRSTVAQQQPLLQRLLAEAATILLGKDTAIRQSVACLLAGGHLLIEDIPGVGKTTLAHLLARLFGLDYQRIQFTSDLLPADIIGASIYDREEGRFHFNHGPVFANLVLADEINRATPKAQSALLEAMEEHQVTVDGEIHPLPQPFFVIATQNPAQQIGTFPLPESQLDRFLMRIGLGYPDPVAERQLLAGEDRRELLDRLLPVMGPEQLLAIRQQLRVIHVAPALLDYVQALLAASRESGHGGQGLSPRAGLGLVRAARAWALLDGRLSVIPEDVQAVWPVVAAHRLAISSQLDTGLALAERLLAEVAIP